MPSIQQERHGLHVHWQKHCQHPADIPISPSASTLGDWRVPGIVAGGRAWQAARWATRGWTQPIQLHLTAGSYKRAEALCHWTLQMTLSGVGCLCCGKDRNSRNMTHKKRMTLLFQSKSQVRWPQRDRLRREQNCLAFLQAPVTSALGFTRDKLWTREDVFISSVD